MSDCVWTFSLEASAPKPAGLDPINVYRTGDSAPEKADSTPIGGTLEFAAQFGLGKVQTPPTGKMQLLHGGQVVEEHPLAVGTDPLTHAPAMWIALKWEESDAKLIGANVARFIVKIGATTFTQSRAFTVLP